MKLIILVLSLLVSAQCFAEQYVSYWNKPTIKSPANYIFSYGLVVNSEIRKSDNGLEKQIYKAIPARVSPDFGYIRGWNYNSSYGKTAIGLRKAIKGEFSSINGIIHPVKDEKDFPASFKSEYGHNLIEVPAQYIEASGWQQLPKNAKFWTYIVGDGYIREADKEHPITQAYLDMVIQGFLEYGVDYAKEFITTTDGWSKYWLNDRVMARNPWYFKGEYKDYNLIDTLLEDYFTKEAKTNFLKDRKFSEEY